MRGTIPGLAFVARTCAHTHLGIIVVRVHYRLLDACAKISLSGPWQSSRINSGDRSTWAVESDFLRHFSSFIFNSQGELREAGHARAHHSRLCTPAPYARAPPGIRGWIRVGRTKSSDGLGWTAFVLAASIPFSIPPPRTNTYAFASRFIVRIMRSLGPGSPVDILISADSPSIPRRHIPPRIFRDIGRLSMPLAKRRQFHFSSILPPFYHHLSIFSPSFPFTRLEEFHWQRAPPVLIITTAYEGSAIHIMRLNY
jgi:hypothetical protein